MTYSSYRGKHKAHTELKYAFGSMLNTVAAGVSPAFYREVFARFKFVEQLAGRTLPDI